MLELIIDKAAKRAGESVWFDYCSKDPDKQDPMVVRHIDRLYRNRILTMDHILVMRHYGRKGQAPDLRRKKEVKARGLWDEAMCSLGAIFKKEE